MLRVWLVGCGFGKLMMTKGNRLMRIVRRGLGSVVTWRRAQMVLWPAQGMSVPRIAGLAFTSEDRVRDVLHNFNADGFSSLCPRYAGGRPPKSTLSQRREIKAVAKSRPAEHGLRCSREIQRNWSGTSRPADHENAGQRNAEG